MRALLDFCQQLFMLFVLVVLLCHSIARNFSHITHPWMFLWRNASRYTFDISGHGLTSVLYRLSLPYKLYPRSIYSLVLISSNLCSNYYQSIWLNWGYRGRIMKTTVCTSFSNALWKSWQKLIMVLFPRWYLFLISSAHFCLFSSTIVTVPM